MSFEAAAAASMRALHRRSIFVRRVAWGVLLMAFALAAPPAGSADADVLRNPFHDPMLQVTHGMPACPEPEEPLYTEQEVRDLSHERSQRGVSCWLAGRCRLPNGYLYDKEIVPRVEIAVNETTRYSDTSVWALSQRRRVWLRGCVQTAEQAAQIEATVRHIDDVEDVQNELMVGDRGTPRYLVRRR